MREKKFIPVVDQLRNGEIEEKVFKPLQVEVFGDFNSAVRTFNSLVQKERILAKIKEKMSYEKPSDRKRRKAREAREKAFIAQSRQKMIDSGEWDKRQRKRIQKKEEKVAKDAAKKKQLEEMYGITS